MFICSFNWSLAVCHPIYQSKNFTKAFCSCTIHLFNGFSQRLCQILNVPSCIYLLVIRQLMNNLTFSGIPLSDGSINACKTLSRWAVFFPLKKEKRSFFLVWSLLSHFLFCWEQVSPCNSGSLPTSDSPISACPLLGLQMWATPTGKVHVLKRATWLPREFSSTQDSGLSYWWIWGTIPWVKICSHCSSWK